MFATIQDPKFKELAFLTEGQKKAGNDNFRKFYSQKDKANLLVEGAEVESPSPKRITAHLLYQLLANFANLLHRNQYPRGPNSLDIC